MEKLAIMLFDLGLISIYLLIGFIGLMIVQLISYKIFNFNLYKNLKYILIDSQLNK